MKMSSNKHITDSFKAVKRTGRRQNEKKEPASVVADQSDTSDMKVLKQFDLTLEYGPCVGITRLERWERAEKHGLNPPTQVRDIVEKHKDNPEYLQCLWKDYEL